MELKDETLGISCWCLLRRDFKSTKLLLIIGFENALKSVSPKKLSGLVMSINVSRHFLRLWMTNYQPRHLRIKHYNLLHLVENQSRITPLNMLIILPLKYGMYTIQNRKTQKNIRKKEQLVNKSQRKWRRKRIVNPFSMCQINYMNSLFIENINNWSMKNLGNKNSTDQAK